MARGVSKSTERKESAIAQCKVKCKCGCVSLITSQRDWKICRWCGHKIYRTKEIEFKYKMKEALK